MVWDEKLILVGGQAVNFWATWYENQVPELACETPFTSGDIDFCGDRQAVRKCAECLGGTPRLPTFDDAATPNSGTVVFVDDADVRYTFDILSAPHGLKAAEVHETAIPVDVPFGDGAVTFYVMHPVLCMESRVHNVAGLSGYDTEHGRKQLRASILFASAFLRDVLDGQIETENPNRAVLGLNERIFRFCTRNLHAKNIYRTRAVSDEAASSNAPAAGCAAS